ncbi:MAG TPA: class I SAM-dependent methyltransferase [Ferruginibacter sp.]|nr:class I SAM-dependent methyltransferase [Ferruginibacter sp.]HRE62211.1 class I SAM-dependent methyltransferase [Ferruginibacter sp.]
MIHYEQCPVCSGKNIQNFLRVKDYTVSGETYPLYQCSNCSFVFTQDIPSQEEIGKYYQSQNYISHSDTQQGLVNKLYHKVRKITLSGKRKLVAGKTGLTKGNLLDVGCGTGAFLNEMKLAGWQITGLEPDEVARKNANDLYAINPMPSHEIFNLPQSSYDAITLWHVLEHVHQLNEYVAQLNKLLKPAGVLFIAVPNYTSGDALHYKSHWAAYDVPRHLYHFSPNSMKLLMQNHGMNVKAIKPMWFDSVYVSMLSEQYKNGKGNIISAAWNGMLSNAKALINKERCSSLIYIIQKN